MCVENFICLENRVNQDSCRSKAEREVGTIAERALNAQSKMAVASHSTGSGGGLPTFEQ